ncbi:4Fe-4S cluster-binding domain-containing protein [Candidatus Poribacteria bacterium]|jgi:hypothetical protein|nr:4Fe-4S cluster-binding domain-containing protein [Candidatus Poribacteria bacterium]MBT5534218.1 4Fe-4S cluster-binding domain-containing protein [Candidatus Poribacteria bacterium]MBT5711696.1 4Fe-4S cluster-binding domain-containing protein [Candidatus Poribacteria bacterium]MBT7100663.1 4Fe-4S cluster-binding domain-containing protein [Candidatus Poribacteria bacterium]MBT7808874.1 4Fe-4S cluster-binding domain-containing protein [Candidatus Poribacteria bacterium]
MAGAENLTGIHFLLTYRCSASCAHCFVWGDPSHRGAIPREDVTRYLDEALEMGTITGIFIEGGEVFTEYADLKWFIGQCSERGWDVSILSNGFWAKTEEIARKRLQPLIDAGLTGMSLSTDEYHQPFVPLERVEIAARVAEELGVNVGRMGTPADRVMFRGRAADSLAPGKEDDRAAWQTFTECTREKLETPGRIHLDKYGMLHLCQGLAMDSARNKPLADAIEGYDPKSHPIVRLLLDGGPARLAQAAQTHGFVPRDDYADECQLCYEARKHLRDRYPDYLGPAEVYGETDPAPALAR